MIGVFQIEFKAALIVVAEREVIAASPLSRRRGSRTFAAGRFDLEDFGTEHTQLAGDERGSDVLADFQYAYTRKRVPCGFRAVHAWDGSPFRGTRQYFRDPGAAFIHCGYVQIPTCHR